MTNAGALGIAPASRRSVWARRFKVFWGSWSTRLSVFGFAALVLVCLVPTAWWPTSAVKINFAAPPQPPAIVRSPVLGTDALGRDMLFRLLRSTRLTLVIAGLATLVATATGTFAGLMAAYHRRWVDHVISRAVDLMLAFPALLLILSLVVAFGQNATSVIIVLSLSGWAGYTRLMRSATITLVDREFIDAAHAMGASGARILSRHLLPNVASAIMVMSTFNLAQFILLESAISFLGLGPAPPAVTWGIMIGDGRVHMYDGWWMAMLPGTAIFGTVLAFNLLGDAMRDAFDPFSDRMRPQRG